MTAMKITKALATMAITAGLAAGCASTPEDGATAANTNDVICRNEHVVGSNMPRRICRTKAERDAIAQQTKEEITNRQRSEESAPDVGLPGT